MRTKEPDLTPMEKSLAVMLLHGDIAKDDVQRRLDCTKGTATRVVGSLMEINIIEPILEGGRTVYRLTRLGRIAARRIE